MIIPRIFNSSRWFYYLPVSLVIGISLVFVSCSSIPSAKPTDTPSPPIDTVVSTPISITISADPERIYSGKLGKVKAYIDGKDVTLPNQCIWSSSEAEFGSPLDCETSYEAPEVENTNTEIEIEVTVYVAERLIGTGSTVVTILQPSNYYTLYILDASARMMEPFDSTTTKMEEATRRLEKHLTYQTDNTNIGLRVFGYMKTSSRSCNNTELLVPVAPGNKGITTQKLHEVFATGEAPLYKALRDGLDDLQPVAGNKYVVVAVFGGADDCQTDETIAGFLNQLRRSAQITENIEFYLLGIQLSEEDSNSLEQIRNTLRTDITFIPISFNYYSLSTTEELDDILLSVSQISNPSSFMQAIGYSKLGQYLEDQGDTRGAQALFGQQKKLEPELDLILSNLEGGLTSIELKDWEAANTEFTQMINQWPDQEMAYFFRGVARVNQGQPSLAAEDFAYASELNPDSALIKYGWGLTLYEVDNPKFQEIVRDAFLSDPNLLDRFYFEKVPPSYTEPAFFVNATSSEIDQAVEDFFTGPVIKDIGKEIAPTNP